MSHYDYIAKCYEDQLLRLIELAREKLDAIRKQGWVYLFVIGDGGINYDWFDNYSDAVQALCERAKRNAEKGQHDELRLDEQRFRPDEAAQLVGETKARWRAFPHRATPHTTKEQP